MRAGSAKVRSGAARLGTLRCLSRIGRRPSPRREWCQVRYQAQLVMGKFHSTVPMPLPCLINKHSRTIHGAVKRVRYLIGQCDAQTPSARRCRYRRRTMAGLQSISRTTVVLQRMAGVAARLFQDRVQCAAISSAASAVHGVLLQRYPANPATSRRWSRGSVRHLALVGQRDGLRVGLRFHGWCRRCCG